MDKVFVYHRKNERRRSPSPPMHVPKLRKFRVKNGYCDPVYDWVDPASLPRVRSCSPSLLKPLFHHRPDVHQAALGPILPGSSVKPMAKTVQSLPEIRDKKKKRELHANETRRPDLEPLMVVLPAISRVEFNSAEIDGDDGRSSPVAATATDVQKFWRDRGIDWSVRPVDLLNALIKFVAGLMEGQCLDRVGELYDILLVQIAYSTWALFSLPHGRMILVSLV